MRSLPLLVDLSKGQIVLVGHSAAARAKLELLETRGARIRWYPGLCPEDERPDSSQVEIRNGEIRKADLIGALAVIVAQDKESDRKVALWARELGVPVNAVDQPELSTFLFPAIVDRGDVVVAIGTGGAAPVLARRLREQIEAILPARLGELAAFLSRVRQSLRARMGRGAQDRHFWQEVIDGPIARHVLEGRPKEAERLLARRGDRLKQRSGKVTLVGAGPGDPDLLTLKALHALQDADVIFYDALVGPEILARARRDAKRICVGKRKGERGVEQEEINRALIEAASSGAHVVRLKGGDPFLFGRGGEEMAALQAAGIEVSIIPGITAALGCAAEAELPLTFRGEANRLVILTGHFAKGETGINWSGLEDSQTTLAIYMGRSSAADIRDGLIAAGRAADTPAAILARGTCPNALTVTGPLKVLPALAAQAGNGPALLIVGEVVARSRAWRDTVLDKKLEVA